MLYQDPTYYNRIKVDSKRAAFMFDNLGLFNKFIEEIDQKSTGKCRKGIKEIPKLITYGTTDIDFYGTTNLSKITNPTDFLFETEMERGIQILKSNNVSVDISDLSQQKVIKFTEQEVGIFSFDLASLGLIPVYEFYSPVLKKIVSPELVVSEKNANGDLLFFHIYTPEVIQHNIVYSIKTAGYYSDILKRNVDKSELIEVSNVEFTYPKKDEVQKHLVNRQQKLDDNGNKKFSTTFKKCFIEIPKVQKEMPRIDIIVGISFSGSVKAKEEMIFNSMPALALAEKLSASSIEYRIIGCYATKCSGKGANGEMVFGFVNIKKEGEILSRNNLELLLSDARYIRNKVFIAKYGMQFDAGFDFLINPGGVGIPIKDRNIIKDAYMDYLKMSNNPTDKEAAKYPDAKIVFSSSLKMQDAQDEYANTIDILKNTI